MYDMLGINQTHLKTPPPRPVIFLVHDGNSHHSAMKGHDLIYLYFWLIAQACFSVVLAHALKCTCVHVLKYTGPFFKV